MKGTGSRDVIGDGALGRHIQMVETCRLGSSTVHRPRPSYRVLRIHNTQPETRVLRKFFAVSGARYYTIAGCTVSKVHMKPILINI